MSHGIREHSAICVWLRHSDLFSHHAALRPLYPGCTRQALQYLPAGCDAFSEYPDGPESGSWILLFDFCCCFLLRYGYLRILNRESIWKEKALPEDQPQQNGGRQYRRNPRSYCDPASSWIASGKNRCASGKFRYPYAVRCFILASRPVRRSCYVRSQTLPWC